MTNYIVLLKQVPDISKISGNVFNSQTGVLMRNKLPSIVNKLDTYALSFAIYMKEISKDKNAKIICLTMGPPQAEAVLKYSYGIGADEIIHLTDPKFGGADTFATANTIACAIKKIVKEHFQNKLNYYILTGMQSCDGDTAQVPPQIATDLQIPCIPYCTDVKYCDKKFKFKKVIYDGIQEIEIIKEKALITVTECKYPLFPSFKKTMEATNKTPIKWNFDDIKPKFYGTSGSKTAVTKVYPPEKNVRKHIKIHNIDELKSIIQDNLQKKNTNDLQIKETNEYVLPKNRKCIFEKNFEANDTEQEIFQQLQKVLEEKKIISKKDLNNFDKTLIASKLSKALGYVISNQQLENILKSMENVKPTYKGDIFVIAEHFNGKILDVTLEILGKAKQLANSLEVKVCTVLIGNKIDHLTQILIQYGADIVYFVKNNSTTQFDSGIYAQTIVNIIKKYLPQIILFGATNQGRVIGPIVSYSLNSGLTADCTDITLKDITLQNKIGILVQTRAALGGNIMANICTKNSQFQMATIRPEIMSKPEKNINNKGQVIKSNINLTKSNRNLKIISEKHTQSEVDFKGMEIIVSGGKGMLSKENYEYQISSLIKFLQSLTNKKIGQGASRAAIENGFAKNVYQIGQSGASVSPQIYFALGISGAIQHIVGIQNSKIIISINSDSNAPIFKESDYYMVAKTEEVIPQLIRNK